MLSCTQDCPIELRPRKQDAMVGQEEDTATLRNLLHVLTSQ